MQDLRKLSSLSLAVSILWLGCGFAGASAGTKAAAKHGLTSGEVALVIGGTDLAAGVENTPYSTKLEATGGKKPYKWSLKSGSLPLGLRLTKHGVLEGTPMSAGAFTFTVQLEDGEKPVQVATVDETLTIAAQLSIDPPAFGTGQKGNAYSATLHAMGGKPSYKWSVSSGSLPAGLTLSTSGVISGTPTVAGSSNFALQVSDSGSPAQVGTASASILVQSAPLSITAISFPAAQVGTSYSQTLQVTGGMPAYTWSLGSGSLPAGLTLSSSGVLSGTPTAAGTSTFTVAVADSSSPIETQTASAAVTVKAANLVLGTNALSSGQKGTTYSATLTATGGTPAYTWTLASGTLPAGLSLSANGTISGTPTSTGGSSFTVKVVDSGSPSQTATQALALSIATATTSTTPGGGNAWYVRPDGGTRYVASGSAGAGNPTGQCDGLGDAAYPGSGVNQHCAFNDVRWLWSDGEYAALGAYPSWGWVIKGGDTVILRGSIANGVSYRVGWNNPSNAFDSNLNLWLGFNGDPYDSAMPPMPSGTAAQPTRFLGENYKSCSAQTARTQLHGGYGVTYVLNLKGSSNVDAECLDITDFSPCSGVGSAIVSCNKNAGTLSDNAQMGIVWQNTSTNDTINNVRIHGLSGEGMAGPTGDGVVMTNLAIIGNGGAGWNADPSDGTTGTGSLLMQNFNISWNGCAEEYPIVDALPYFQCADDSSQGYGDGFGTATLLTTGWKVHFDQGVVSYNTQDGLDALHLVGPGSSMTITRVLAYGNMGQQLKNGGSAGTSQNNVIITNCNALRYPIPGTPAGYNVNLSDFCRAADAGVLLTVAPNSTTKFDNNTIYSASATAVEIGCDTTDGACNATSLIDYRNNIFVGFLNSPATGYPYSDASNNSNPIYDGTGIWPFGNPGSFFSNNITWHAKNNWTCPALDETNSLCTDPLLQDETWHVYGYPNVAPTSNSPALGKGAAIPGLTVDFNGTQRADPPTIGAYEN